MSESAPESPNEVASEESVSDEPIPSTLTSTLHELLRRPEQFANRLDGRTLRHLLIGGFVCCALYGAAAGMFQGGSQIALAALKVPLIVFCSLLLCAPSFYVLSALGGVETTPRRVGFSMFGFGAMIGLLLTALMPIAWLFSVSSRTVVFPVFLHALVWVIALSLGCRFLDKVLKAAGGRISNAWILLFLLVSLQVASQMRPLLWRADGMDFFEPRRMFFLEHFQEVLEDGSRIGPGRD